jgi:hypothetical protein
MEYMSAGIPAIAPQHSAMLDYIDKENSFIINSYQEWTHWPHDPRYVNRTFRAKICWQSLCEQYLTSFNVAVEDRDLYMKKSVAASHSLFEYCSDEKVTEALVNLLSTSPYTPTILQRIKLMVREKCGA